MYQSAEAAFGQGRWADAADAFKQSVAADPNLRAAHTGLARSLPNQHRVTEAVEQGRRAVEQNPTSSDARATLAVALDWMGLVDRAVQTGQEAVNLDQSSPRALAALAEAYADQYRLQEADEYLTQALALGSDDPEVHRERGRPAGDACRLSGRRRILPPGH